MDIKKGDKLVDKKGRKWESLCDSLDDEWVAVFGRCKCDFGKRHNHVECHRTSYLKKVD